jgi:hypothetical protein
LTIQKNELQFAQFDFTQWPTLLWNPFKSVKQCPCFMCAAPSRLSRLPSFFDDSLAPFDDGCGPGLPHRRCRPVCELGSEFGVSARSTTEIDGMPNNMYTLWQEKGDVSQHKLVMH